MATKLSNKEKALVRVAHIIQEIDILTILEINPIQAKNKEKVDEARKKLYEFLSDNDYILTIKKGKYMPIVKNNINR